MVKKLWKHEISALGRLMLPVLCAVLAVGAFTRLLLVFESDNLAFNIVKGSSIGLLFIAVIAGMLFSVIFGVVRYYKNLFSCEGYLSFTLPVTTSQHLWVKAVTAVMAEIAAVLAGIMALVIAFSGEKLEKFMKEIGYVWKGLSEEVGAVQLTLFVVEVIFLLLTGLFYMNFMYYTCITIGQTAKKNRIMFAVAVYFIYYIITQIVGTIVIVVFTVSARTLAMDKIADFITEHIELCIHLCFLGFILFLALLTLVFYCICRFVIRKKLNLE